MFRYKPIVRASAGSYFGCAMVGTYSTIIGWSFEDENLRDGLLGFAVKRTEFLNSTGEQIELKWLGGYKRFVSEDDGRAGDVGSLTAPFQRFRWNDYTLRPGRSYRYEVFPMRGAPGSLSRNEDPLVFEFSPTPEYDESLGVYVNRGVTAAKAYFERFGDTHPRDAFPKESAYAWLSRGLKESLLDLINSSVAGDAIHMVIYEFHDSGVAKSLKEAISRNVEVAIIHDAKAGKRSTEKTDKKFQDYELSDVAIRRDTVNISHNKLAILLQAGNPTQVWTGSANLSENAFNFQTNTALLVNDTKVAGQFENYFQSLIDNPSKAETKKNNRQFMKLINSQPNRFAHTTYFSPLSQLDILETAIELIDNAEDLVLVSAPFAVDQSILKALKNNSRAVVEYGLVNATAQRKVAELNHHNTRFYPPRNLKTFQNERWDAKAFGAHKIHAKSIIVDPYSDNPKVLVGSANFSKASCKDNDENAFLIEGDKRLAAILTTEFMRMYDHYKIRWFISEFEEENKKIRKENKRLSQLGQPTIPEKVLPKHLKEDSSWSNTAFDPTSFSHKFRDREVFSS